jgi:hypothetical protein
MGSSLHRGFLRKLEQAHLTGDVEIQMKGGSGKEVSLYGSSEPGGRVTLLVTLKDT